MHALSRPDPLRDEIRELLDVARSTSRQTWAMQTALREWLRDPSKNRLGAEFVARRLRERLGTAAALN